MFLVWYLFSSLVVGQLGVCPDCIMFWLMKLLFFWCQKLIIYTPSITCICIQFFFWNVPPIVYISKVVNSYNVKHHYTNYFLPISPFYNNRNTITPTNFLHYLKSIIKYKWVPPLYSLFIKHYSFLHFFLGFRVPNKCIQLVGTERVLSWSLCPSHM